MPVTICYHPAVRRFLKLLATVWLISALLPSPASNGMTDEERKQAFLKAREEMKTVESPTPATANTPKPKPAAHRRTPSPSPKATTPPKATPAPTARKRTPEPLINWTPEPTSSHQPTPKREETPKKPTQTPTPRPTPSPTPAPTPPPRNVQPEQKAPVVVVKGGENVPEPPPPPEPRGWWPWSRPANYKYLTRPVIDAIRNAPVSRGRWRYIVVHNSGTRQGNAKVFDYYHLHTRKMPNGLAYHFVIGNGSSSGDGQIEIGNRWRRQINGGHVHSDFLNSIALGICLVGDYNRDQPTKKQLEALDELIRYLRQRCGKFEGHVAIVKAHKEINPVPTDCPGDRFPYAWLHRTFN